jgi:hypothetical protein
MTCPFCGGAVEFVALRSYAGLHLQPDVSVFRCAEHGPLMMRRAGAPPLPPRFDWTGGSDAGDPRVRVPLVPRPNLLAGAIALPEPDDDRPADRIGRSL